MEKKSFLYICMHIIKYFVVYLIPLQQLTENFNVNYYCNITKNTSNLNIKISVLFFFKRKFFCIYAYILLNIVCIFLCNIFIYY